MNGFLNKKINHRIKNWLAPVKYAEMQSKNAVRNQYTNLYAYAANNPVHYIDPDGRKAKNNSDQYIVVRLESDDEPCHYMILAPGDIINANCDGAVFSSGNMFKVSAYEKWDDVVNFTIWTECFLGVIATYDDIESVWTNYSRDFIKEIYNYKCLAKNFKHFFTDQKYDTLKFRSGSYINQKKAGSPLNSWWDGITNKDKGNLGSTQKEWKEKYENDPKQKELQQKYLQKESEI